MTTSEQEDQTEKRRVLLQDADVRRQQQEQAQRQQSGTYSSHAQALRLRIARICCAVSPCGGEEADHVVKTGTGPQRVFHNIHNPGSARQHGPDNKGEGDIHGNKRGVV